ncbi:hypothetical protein [Bacillus sp. AK031]
MKKLSIYKENGEFVIERTNEFNHATKRLFASEEGLKDGIQAYMDFLDEYELNVSDELWATVINILNSPKMYQREQLYILFALHKKMYDVRWNGASGDHEELKKEFVQLAKQNGVHQEVQNTMFEQLYIPPYEEDKLPDHLKANSHGGRREGAGRPSVGTTRRVALTLPDEIWEMIDKRKETWGASQSATLRMMIEGYFYSEDEE